MAFVLILTALARRKPSAEPSAKSNLQNAKDCSVNIYGNHNSIGDLKCTGIDANLAKQFKDIAAGTHRNSTSLGDISKQLQLIIDKLNSALPPPRRVVSLMNADAAIAILRSAPSGSSVRLAAIGGGSEINTFLDQVIGLFRSAQWQVAGPDRIGQAIISTSFDTSHGEGLNCESLDFTSAAAVAATQALKVAGFPCDPIPHPLWNRRSSEDFYISIGTRIKVE